VAEETEYLDKDLPQGHFIISAKMAALLNQGLCSGNSSDRKSCCIQW